MRHGLLIWLGLLLLVGACARHGHEPSTEKTTMIPPLKLEVTASPTSLSFGDTLDVQIEVTNPAPQPVTRRFRNGCIYGFTIWSPAGRAVAPPPPMCTMAGETVVYEPDEVVVEIRRWVWEDPQITPGEYTLTAGFGPRGQTDPGPPITLRLR
jgi:hypothetical protein